MSDRQYRREDIIEKGGKQPPNPPPPPMSQAHPPLPPPGIHAGCLSATNEQEVGAVSDQLTDEQVAWHVKYHNADWARHNLACEVQASRKLIADLRALHAPELDEADGLSVWCAECDPDCIDTYPCPTIRLIEEAGI